MRGISIKRCVLAVDSGGTKCDAMLIGDDGAILGWGHCDHTDPNSGRGRGGSGRSEESVLAAVEQAIGDVRCDELHIVGTRYSGLRKLIDDGRVRAAEFHPAGESAMAFSLAGIDFGVAIIAGTGTLVYGRNRDGQDLTLDGLGPMLGDYGSAFFIGLLAIRAAAKSGWHPRRRTSLAEVVNRECLGKELDGSTRGLVGYMLDSHDRAEIAHLARFVDAEANAGDAVSISILKEAATAAAETVRDLADRLGMGDEDYTLVGMGSVARRSEIYWQHLCEAVSAFAPRLKPVLPQAPPVVGMALIALRKLDPENVEALRGVLLKVATDLC